ncbi:hypothetical protein HK102_005023 [Quaeritorhiza haematococci]|nr:hypothetical protein HK102_005023 [Quaeritorhiza haematococci]
MSLLKLQKEVAAAKIENDRLQSMWLEAQKENLKCKEAVNQLTNELSYLKTQLGIADNLKTKNVALVNETKKEAIEYKLEASKLYNELRKLQPLVEDLKSKNIQLERQLAEARLQLEKANLDSTTSTQMLKMEVRRLYQERLETRKARFVDERHSSVWERKFVLAREMLDKFKAERHELQRVNFELKCRSEDMEKRYNELKTQYQNFTAQECFIQKGFQIKFELKLEWHQLRRFSTWSDEIPDFDAWRLKLDSLTTERDFLINENKMLNHKIDEYISKTSTLEKQLAESQNRLKSTEKEHKAEQQQLKVLTDRCARIEKVAAHIERQYKEAHPNIKIDYVSVNDAEPSIQLLAAFMPREPVMLGMDSAPPPMGRMAQV